MSLEENKAKVRKVIEAINEQNLDFVDSLTASDYFDHTHQLNPEGVKQFMNMIFKAFPDWHETIEDIIAEEDKVWVHTKATGTHTGEYRGLAPTNKKITGMGVNIYRIVNGEFVEGWAVEDWLDFLMQLGVVDYKGFPDEVKS
jgi:predicted ester cyclase